MAEDTVEYSNLKSLSKCLPKLSSEQLETVQNVISLIKTGDGLTVPQSTVVAATFLTRVLLLLNTTPSVDNTPADRNIHKLGNKDITNKIVGTQSKKGKLDFIKAVVEPVGDKNPILTTADGKNPTKKPNIFHIKKCETDISLTTILNDLAMVVVILNNNSNFRPKFTATKTKRNNVMIEKGNDHITDNHTIVANALLKILEMIENSRYDGYLMKSLGRIVLIKNNVLLDRTYTSVTAQKELQFILQAFLRSILLDLKKSMEAAHDFEYLWESTLNDSSACRGESATRIMGETAKEFVPLLTSVISLHCHTLDQTPIYDPSLSYYEQRKERILSNAACISLLFQNYSATEVRKPIEITNGAKRQRLEGLVGGESNSSITNHSCHPTNKRHTSAEDDAIAALSMMVAGNSTVSPSNVSLVPPTKKKFDVSDNMIDSVLQSSNRLLSNFQCIDSGPFTSLTRADLSAKMNQITSHVVHLYGSKLIPKFEGRENSSGYNKTDVKTQNTPSSCISATRSMVSSSHVNTLRCQGLRSDRFSLSSYADTYPTFVANKNALYTIYRKLMCLSVKKELIDPLSITTNLKFVEEPLLFTRPYRAMRKVLINCSNFKSANRTMSIQATSFAITFVPSIKDKSFNCNTNIPGINLSLPQVFPETNVQKNESHSFGRRLHNNQHDSFVPTTVVGSHQPVPKILPSCFITESKEINEWAHSILSIASAPTTIKPSTRLCLYLESSYTPNYATRKPTSKGRDDWKGIVVPILRQTLIRLVYRVPHNDNTKNSIHSLNAPNDNGELIPILRTSLDHVASRSQNLARALTALYYHSLESVLYYETARMKSASHPKLVMNISFHKALLSVSYMCLMKATSGLVPRYEHSHPNKVHPETPVDVHSILQIMDCTAYEFLKVNEAFMRAFLCFDHSGITSGVPLVTSNRNSSSVKPGLPLILRRYLQNNEELILDSLLWVSNQKDGITSNTVSVIKILMKAKDDGFDCRWPPAILQPCLPQEKLDEDQTPYEHGSTSANVSSFSRLYHEYTYVTYLFKKIIKVTSHRITALCIALQIPPQYPVATQIWVIFRSLLRHNVQLLFDRHIDQLILCTIYSVCKKLKFTPDLSFAKIIKAYTDLNMKRLGDKVCQRIIRSIVLDEDGQIEISHKNSHYSTNKNKRRTGNVIQFYNEIYVPVMQKFLLKSKSMEMASVELRSCMIKERAKGIKSMNFPLIEEVKSSPTSSSGCHPMKSSSYTKVQNNNFLVKYKEKENEGISGQPAQQHNPSNWNPTSSKTLSFYTFGYSNEKVRTAR